MVDFFSGAATVAFLVAAAFFTRFWRRTSDRLFLAFAIAFTLLAINQALSSALDVVSELHGHAYALRVLGFLIILGAIIDKNVSGRRR